MLVSDSHRFIFVHIRKAAGTTIRQHLSPYAIARPDSLWRKFMSRARLTRDYRQEVFRAHEAIGTLERSMAAELMAGYFKFAFVRNPWDRLVSQYEYILRVPTHSRHRRVSAMKDFKDFIRFQARRRDGYQLEYLCDRRGNLAVDFVGRFENLDSDFAQVCRRIGIGYQPLSHSNRTEHGDFRDYYDDEGRRLVAHHWAAEIKQFAYSFENTSNGGERNAFLELDPAAG